MKIFSTIFTLFIASLSFAQDFEGVVEFTKVNYLDETNYIYYISPTNIRIDELDDKGNIQGTMLVNLTLKTTIAVNHERKLYMEIKSSPSIKNLNNTKISKTKETKMVLGHLCTKWVVSNSDYKTKATYWVVNEKKYSFFKNLLSTLNRKDKIALYFMQIPGNMGFFPILGEEVGFDGKLRTRLKTTKLTPKKVVAKKFAIPVGYKKFGS